MADQARFTGRMAAVTGAGGFIGGAIARRLAGEGAEVRGLDSNADAARRIEDGGATFVQADITDRATLDAGLDGAELVVHTAAHVREWGAMEDFIEVNVRGTRNVLDAADVAGVGRVVHISSVVVYGYDDPSHQEEHAHRRAYGLPYIDTKSASDRLACRRGAIVVRPGDVYGPGSSNWVVRPVAMARAGQLALPGQGDGQMLPIYIDDLVEAVLCALERGEPGATYTVWDGEAVPFAEYFGRIAEIAGARPPRRAPRALLEAAGGALERWAGLRGKPPALTGRAITFIDRRGTASNERARRELGWQPRVSFDEGMRRTEAWLRAEGIASSASA
jgi:nucleoside-diphosphate-sugar epimerase